MNAMGWGIFSLVIICLVLLGLLFASREVEKERQELETKTQLPHPHVWRSITEWARRCTICGVIEISPDAPEGMPEYIQAMTTRLAVEDPIREALIYSAHDPRMIRIGANVCELCQRPYPKFYPHCPYCDDRPEPSY